MPAQKGTVELSVGRAHGKSRLYTATSGVSRRARGFLRPLRWVHNTLQFRPNWRDSVDTYGLGHGDRLLWCLWYDGIAAPDAERLLRAHG